MGFDVNSNNWLGSGRQAANLFEGYLDWAFVNGAKEGSIQPQHHAQSTLADFTAEESQRALELIGGFCRSMPVHEVADFAHGVCAAVEARRRPFVSSSCTTYGSQNQVDRLDQCRMTVLDLLAKKMQTDLAGPDR
jgi:hypothetical protein